MKRGLISVILNAIILAILNMDLYTDRAMMPDGRIREWHRSPIARLALNDITFLLYLQIAVSALSVITAILTLLGVRKSIIQTVHLVSTAAAAVIFIIIMIVTANIHVKYA